MSDNRWAKQVYAIVNCPKCGPEKLTISSSSERRLTRDGGNPNKKWNAVGAALYYNLLKEEFDKKEQRCRGCDSILALIEPRDEE